MRVNVLYLMDACYGNKTMMGGGGKTDRRRCTRTEKVGEGGEILFQVPVKELFRVTFR